MNKEIELTYLPDKNLLDLLYKWEYFFVLLNLLT